MNTVIQVLKTICRYAGGLTLRAYLLIQPRSVFDQGKINRILVFAYHGLGNFIMYSPALNALRDRYPNARIDLQVGNNTGCEEVLAGTQIFQNIYNLPYSAGLRAWLRHAVEIRRTGYDITINEFHSHSWRLALLIAFARAPFRAGHVTSPGWSRRFSRYSFIFNIPVAMREDEHEVERYSDLTAAVGARPVKPAEAKPLIHLAAEDLEFASAFLAARVIGQPPRIIGVQPGTSPTMRWKQWPPDRYRALIERIVSNDPDCALILFGSPAEAEMIYALGHGLGPNVLIAAGHTTVKQVAALIGRCDALICNDSGLMHVAVAVGTPVIAIYGPTDIRRTAPLGPNQTVIRRDLACSPCFRLEGDDQVHRCPHHDCLMTISVDDVFEAVDQASQRLYSLSKNSEAGVG